MRLPLRPLVNRSIRGKIFLVCGVLAVPFVALAVATAMLVQGIKAESDAVQQDTIPVIESYEVLRLAGMRVIETTNTFALINTFGQAEGQAQNSFSVDKKNELTKAKDEFVRALDKIDGLDDENGGGTERFKRNVRFAHQDILKQSDKIVGLVAKRAAPNTILSARERFENSAVNFRNLIGTAINAEKDELVERQAMLNASLSSTLAMVVGIGAVGVLLAFAAGHQLSRRLATPIHQLRDAAARVGEGDFEALQGSPLQGRRDRDEIAELVRSFGKMSARLQQLIQDHARGERLAMLGQVAATVSHELRNPLAAIRNSMFLIRQSAAGKEPGNQRAFERVERNIDRCTRIIADMLEYTRTKSLRREPVVIGDWLAELLDEHPVPSGISVERDIRYAGAVEVDPDRFRQVLVNLIDNAAQALTDQSWEPGDGRQRRITLRTDAAGSDVVLSVADNGPGISEDTLAKIFEPLFTTKNFGVGLGLPTARQLVEQHGGTVEVDSKVGEGTVFTIRLPVAASLPDAQAA